MAAKDKHQPNPADLPPQGIRLPLRRKYRTRICVSFQAKARTGNSGRGKRERLRKRMRPRHMPQGWAG